MPDLQSTDCGCAGISSKGDTTAVYQYLYDAGAPLAMGYVPYQRWDRTYELCRALQVGTLFPCLHKPFCGKGGRFR